MSKENEVIKTVQSMLNEKNYTPKDELIVAITDLGWKTTSLNFALSRLKKAGAIKENENKEFILVKEIKGDIVNQTPKKTYKAKKSRYKGHIPELTPEQEEFKELVNNNRDSLMEKEITWVDENGMEFPLEIAGMGDITLRCRFYLANFMKVESQTGALIYIPWHEESISQLFGQVEEILSHKKPVKKCVNFQQMAPAK